LLWDGFYPDFLKEIQLDLCCFFLCHWFCDKSDLVLPLTHNIHIDANTNWLNAPLVVYLFPLMGGLLAPIYPSINSVILASIPKYLHSAMSGLIVVFSAIGGTIGSIITGFVFQEFSGQQAFYLSLIPLSLLITSAVFMNKLKINPKK
jgi:fucose permease